MFQRHFYLLCSCVVLFPVLDLVFGIFFALNYAYGVSFVAMYAWIGLSAVLQVFIALWMILQGRYFRRALFEIRSRAANLSPNGGKSRSQSSFTKQQGSG